MQFPKVSTLVVSAAALTCSYVAMADQPAAPQSVAVECETLTAAAKEECERVAREMDKSQRDLTHSSSAPNDPQNDPQYVSHSSPIMTTKEEKAVTDAPAKGKDPQAELKKVRAGDQAVQQQPTQPQPTQQKSTNKEADSKSK